MSAEGLSDMPVMFRLAKFLLILSVFYQVSSGIYVNYVNCCIKCLV